VGAEYASVCGAIAADSHQLKRLGAAAGRAVAMLIARLGRIRPYKAAALPTDFLL